MKPFDSLFVLLSFVHDPEGHVENQCAEIPVIKERFDIIEPR